jgi:gliding motility-associated-like protein
MFGCQTTIELPLSITLSYRVMIPTGFTPNQNENNFFRPKLKGIVEMELLIFNLWGNLIFRADDLNSQGWDGRLNGELSPEGNYVFRINMVSVDGEVINERGSFILIR